MEFEKLSKRRQSHISALLTLLEDIEEWSVTLDQKFHGGPETLYFAAEYLREYMGLK